MILTSKIKLNRFLVNCLFLALAFLVLFPSQSSAQQGLSLSVSPTLFEMTASPNQEWSSVVRIINPNSYDITVYADVVNFAPQGESGLGKFLPVIHGDLTSGETLAEWVDVEKKEILVPAEQDLEIPFNITVPENAAPGGHFAALLIGTKPPKSDSDKTSVRTSQIVTTLVFLRVTGDVVESGNIRSFRTTDRILDKPEVTFELRFENKGNVHILPQGEIKILNMWGQVRGVLPVNRQTLFGNVLPDSVRKYDFTWKGQRSMADIGRYTAIATLAYGDGDKQFTSSQTAFWVIPWKIIGSVFLVLIFFVLFLTWGIKLYIRKMLSMAGVPSGNQVSRSAATLSDVHKVSVVAPIEAGMLDLRQRMQETTSVTNRIKILFGFIGTYKLFFVGLALVMLFLAILFVYIKSASVSERAYEVTIDGLSDEIRISSEELAYDKLESSVVTDNIPLNPGLPEITIVNRSGVTGMAANLKLFLEKNGYKVPQISSDLNTEEYRTVIVYPPELANDALGLSKVIGDALLSSYDGDSVTATKITVYVGKDFQDVVQ